MSKTNKHSAKGKSCNKKMKIKYSKGKVMPLKIDRVTIIVSFILQSQYCIYSETCLNRTRNKPESCINRIMFQCKKDIC